MGDRIRQEDVRIDGFSDGWRTHSRRAVHLPTGITIDATDMDRSDIMLELQARVDSREEPPHA